jgi:hypothetical protein
MALLRREDHTYGQVLNSHVVSWGTTRDYNPIYVTDVNGWYFKVQLPLPFWRNRLDYETLTVKKGRVHPMLLVQQYNGRRTVRFFWRPV